MIFKALAALVLFFCLVSIRQAQANPAGDVDITIFYNALAPHGNWVNHRSFGRVWYPRNVPRNWRPYTAGYWAYTVDYGWLWVSDWEWGWAPFHYGRWTWDDWYGWIWVPGRIWAPAWVFWRYGGGYMAWAPMPPNYIWRPYASFQTYYFDYNRYLNWDCWVAVHERDFPRHHKHRRLLAPQQNRDVLKVTHIINDVTIINNHVVNLGMPVQQIEKATGARLKPVVPVVLKEFQAEKKIRRDRQSNGPIIYRPKAIVTTMETILDEEKQAQRFADTIDSRPVANQQRNLLEQREPGRLTGKPSPIEFEELPNSISNLPKFQPVRRDTPLLTMPERRLESRIIPPNEQQRPESQIRLEIKADHQNYSVRQRQLEIQQQTEEAQRVREEEARRLEELNRQQEEIQRQHQREAQQQAEQMLRFQEEEMRRLEELNRQQEEIQRQRQREAQQQAEQVQRFQEEEMRRLEELNRQQEEIYRQRRQQEQQIDRQQEMQQRQQMEIRQQAEQAQRAQEAEAFRLEELNRRQEEIYRQQEMQQRQQLMIQQQAEQAQRIRNATRQLQEKTVAPQVLEQQQIQQPGIQRQPQESERGRSGRSTTRGERVR